VYLLRLMEPLAGERRRAGRDAPSTSPTVPLRQVLQGHMSAAGEPTTFGTSGRYFNWLTNAKVVSILHLNGSLRRV
jgi:hypothetical protein